MVASSFSSFFSSEFMILVGALAIKMVSCPLATSASPKIPFEFADHFQIARLAHWETKQEVILIANHSNDDDQKRLFDLELHYHAIQPKKLRLPRLINLSSKALSVFVLGYWVKEFLSLNEDKRQSTNSFQKAQESDLKSSSHKEVRAWNAHQMFKKRVMIYTATFSAYTLLGHLLKPTFGSMDLYQKVFFLEGWENGSRVRDVAQEIFRHVTSYPEEKVFLISIDRILFDQVKNKLVKANFSESEEEE